MADEEKSLKSVELIQERYSTQDLIENCEALTGYKEEVAVGALFNCTEKEITKEDFKERIKNFLGRKVE